MNPHALTSVKLSGNPGIGSWAQLLEFKPADADTLSQKGVLYAIIAKHSSVQEAHGLLGGHLSTQEGRESLLTLQEEYYRLSQTPYKALLTSLEKVKKNLLHISDFEITVAVLLNNFIYVAALGEGSFCLLRNGSLVSLLEKGEKVRSLSGVINEDDAFLLSTKSFIDSVPQGLIKSALASTDPDLIAETLAPYVRGEDVKPDCAAIVIRKGEKLPKPEEKFTSNFTLPQTEVAGKVKAKLLFFTDKLLSLMPQNKITVRGSELDVKSRRKKHLTAILGLVLLLLLVLSIVAGAKRKEYLKQQSLIDSSVETARKNLEEARSLKDLSIERARALLLNAKETIDALKDQGIQNEEVDLVNQSIEDSLGEIAGIYKLPTQTYLDLSLISSDFNADLVSVSEGRFIVGDQNARKLVSISIDTKKTQVIAGPSILQNIQGVGIYADRNFVLTDRGVEEIQNEKLTPAILKDWPGEVLIHFFAGNGYVLDKQDSKIYRYPGGVSGSFGNRQSWLSEDLQADFSDARKLMIDGSLWVQFSDNTLGKYTMGRRESFSFSGSNLQSLDSFFVDEKATYLYLLDKSSKRVLVYDKKGNFKAEYDIPEASEAEEIIVSEEAKRILLITKSKIYFVEAKHL